jgi:hypothetical protein
MVVYIPLGLVISRESPSTRESLRIPGTPNNVSPPRAGVAVNTVAVAPQIIFKLVNRIPTGSISFTYDFLSGAYHEFFLADHHEY